MIPASMGSAASTFRQGAREPLAHTTSNTEKTQLILIFNKFKNILAMWIGRVYSNFTFTFKEEVI